MLFTFKNDIMHEFGEYIQEKAKKKELFHLGYHK